VLCCTKLTGAWIAKGREDEGVHRDVVDVDGANAAEEKHATDVACDLAQTPLPAEATIANSWAVY